MRLLSKFDEEILFLLRVVDIFNKYAWIVLSKIKNALQLLTLFKKILINLDATKIKHGLIKAVNFITNHCYNWLEKNDMEMHSSIMKE